MAHDEDWRLAHLPIPGGLGNTFSSPHSEPAMELRIVCRRFRLVETSLGEPMQARLPRTGLVGCNTVCCSRTRKCDESIDLLGGITP